MMDVRVARMALDIIRTSSLAYGTCSHPAEALTRDERRCLFVCSVCTVAVADEEVARVLADPVAGRVTTRLKPLRISAATRRKR
jgi:hypothetical protein